jgi:ComF family protein
MKNFFLWELLFPGKCVFCRKILPKHCEQICQPCRELLPKPLSNHKKIPFSCGWIAVWQYEDTVRSSLLRFKFGRKRHYASTYGKELASKLQSIGKNFDIITWVPISTRRKLKRGYDQGQLLSLALETHTGIPVLQCLKKRKHNPPQSTLHGEAQRKANVLGVYKAINQSEFVGKRILLLDDIITTGATISECAKTLMLAGAQEVYCAAVASAGTHHK